MRSRVLSGVATSLVAGSLLLGTAACGGTKDVESGKAPKTIYNDALGGLKTAKSFHVDGKGHDKDMGDMTVGLDIAGSDKDHGTIKSDKGSMELIRVGADTYVKGDAQFWTAAGGSGGGAQLAQLAGGKWIKFSGADASNFSDLSDPTTLISDDFESSGSLTKVGKQTVDGTKAVGVKDSKGSVLWVSVGSDHRPVMFDSKASDGAGQFHFSKWNDTSATITAPSGALTMTDLVKQATGQG